MDEPFKPGQKMARVEWIAGAALGISILQGAYLVGFDVQRLAEIERRVRDIEGVQTARAGQIEQLLVTTTRVDANVSALTDRLNEMRLEQRK